jgi:aryl-alcohol dehydrogenase-like predicted oxidoreductase
MEGGMSDDGRMGGIRTRRLGRTGLHVTELGLGAMDTPGSAEALATIEAAAAVGITFIDTAREYAGSEYLLGQFIRSHGAAPFRIATKTFRRTADGAQHEVDRSLSVLGVPFIDLYQLHDISTEGAWEEAMSARGALEGLKVAQYRGLIGHIGVSSHDLGIAERAVRSGEFDTVMVEYSAFFPESAPLIELAAERDVGVIVMRPLGGSGRMSVIRGLMERGEAGVLTPANLLRYAWSHPGVSVAIPGARYPSRVHENASIAADYAPMSAAERRELEAAARRLYDG